MTPPFTTSWPSSTDHMLPWDHMTWSIQITQPPRWITWPEPVTSHDLISLHSYISVVSLLKRERQKERQKERDRYRESERGRENHLAGCKLFRICHQNYPLSKQRGKASLMMAYIPRCFVYTYRYYLSAQASDPYYLELYRKALFTVMLKNIWLHFIIGGHHFRFRQKLNTASSHAGMDRYNEDVTKQ